MDYRDAKGKRHREVPSDGGKSKRLAERELRGLLNKIDAGTLQTNHNKLTFKDFVQLWIRERKHTLKPGTWETYDGQIRLYLLHSEFGLGAIKLSHINQEVVKRFRVDLIDQFLRPDHMEPSRPRQAPKGYLSERSLNAILTLLGTILQDAVGTYIPSNPALKLQKFKKRKTDAIPLDIDRGEEQIALETARRISFDVYMMVVLSICAGPRRGELCALRWSNLDVRDPQSPTLSIGENYANGIIHSPKTETSHRTVDLAPELVPIINEFKLYKGNPSGDTFVFDSGSGKPIHPDTISSVYWKRIASEGELRGLASRTGPRKPLTWHSLRHTFAAIQIMHRVPPKAICEMMGHSSIMVTMDIYGHLFPSMTLEAARMMGKLVFGANSKRSGHKLGTNAKSAAT
ncbi:MAG: site-specific integrase [bacterium]|nr:site-specific integrase [bacterium]